MSRVDVVVSLSALSKQNGHTDTAAKPGMAANGAPGGRKGWPVEEVSYELKLTITDSAIVVVEDTSQWDTNAVILKVSRVL
jgi:hypothetical protein